jgi:hypothetical protein
MLDIPFISLPVPPPIFRNKIHPVHWSKCAIFYIFRPRCCQQFYRNRKRPVDRSKCLIFYLFYFQCRHQFCRNNIQPVPTCHIYSWSPTIAPSGPRQSNTRVEQPGLAMDVSPANQGPPYLYISTILIQNRSSLTHRIRWLHMVRHTVRCR